MSALTSDRNTLERVPQMRTPEAAGTIYAGSLVAVNANGKAVAASDTAGLVVTGCARHGAAAGEKVTVKTGCFAFDAPSGETLSAGDIGKTVYVVDDQTVSLTGGTNGVKAGVVFDVDSEGVWVGIDFSSLPPDSDHDHDSDYQAKATPATAIADVAEAGDGSANLISGLNGVLAILRTNGLLAAN